MSIYSTVESGTKAYRSRFHKSISYTKHYDCAFGEIIPVLEKFVLPGDVWRIGGECLVRFLPMVSPSFTPNKLKVRYFFVPLRLVEKNAELILTGSKDGHLYSGTLPTFKNFVDEADKTVNADAFKVQKHSFWDYLGIPVGDYEAIKNDECLPAQYWLKAYCRCLWDYYFDENISAQRQTYTDFDNYVDTVMKIAAHNSCNFAELPKDYVMSALPWQLKGTAPVLNVTGNGTFQPNFNVDLFGTLANPSYTTNAVTGQQQNDVSFLSMGSIATNNVADAYVNSELNKTQQNVSINGLGFTADDLRTMMAQTRIFERLARTGSRYTEYLKANFGVAPEDGTLQRAQYLGGWSLPILTTEVLQTGEDGSNPVGTMRGHGISRGGNKIQTFYAKEFGVILGLAHILPKVQYTNGIKRELSYKRRFDFFNPSLQHLSEQEIRNGELYVSFTDGLNDDTFGFQAYANELRSSRDVIVGDMRDSLSYWNQAITFNSRPNLNAALINSANHRAEFNKCFVGNSITDRNIIVDFYNDLDVYRPMVKYATPGLVDHL